MDIMETLLLTEKSKPLGAKHQTECRMGLDIPRLDCRHQLLWCQGLWRS